MTSNNDGHVRIMDFERSFKCVKSHSRNHARFIAVLKAIDALALFNNSLFQSVNFTEKAYPHSIKIYLMMQNYIRNLLPTSKQYLPNQDTINGPKIDTSILQLFTGNFDDKYPHYGVSKQLLERLHSGVCRIFESNVLWWKSATVSQNFLQYTQSRKYKYLDHSS